MATVKIDRFGGIMPRQHPTQLADGMAVRAHNLRLKRGKLVPLRQPALVPGASVLMEGGLTKIEDAMSLHVWRKANGSFDFLAFKGVTWMAPGTIADDDKTRVVVSGDRTGDGNVDEPVMYARVVVNGVVTKTTIPLRKEALPTPAASRTDGDLPADAGNIRYTSFFWSWADAYGYESPVSEPSNEVEYLDGDSITITTDSGATALTKAWLEGKGADVVRIYKVVTGMETGRIQFVFEKKVAELGDSEVAIQFTVKDENAGEVMPEIEAPPADLTCIQDVPGGYYCGFSPSAPKTVMFSDIDLPYSWPIAYRYDVADNLVALAVTSNSVFALTDGWPYVLSGTAPESMSVAKLAGPAACVSPRGVCVYRNAVYYVSNAGLMTIQNSADSGTVCANLTDKMFTKDQWLALNPKSCIMGQFDGALFMFFTAPEGTVYTLSFIDPDGTLHMSQTTHVGLTIDLLDGPTIAVTTHDEAARCLCTDNAEDRMYYVREVR